MRVSTWLFGHWFDREQFDPCLARWNSAVPFRRRTEFYLPDISVNTLPARAALFMMASVAIWTVFNGESRCRANATPPTLLLQLYLHISVSPGRIISFAVINRAPVFFFSADLAMRRRRRRNS